MATVCPQLRYINLSVTGVTDLSVQYLAENCHMLEGLNLKHNENRITENSIEMLIQGCPLLKKLNIAKYTSKTDQTINFECK